MLMNEKKIFKTHGVWYSVLVELEYWDIVDYHVVDSMHSLLLGLLSWHLRRFWSMEDKKNEEDILCPITKSELHDLVLDHSKPMKSDFNEEQTSEKKNDEPNGIKFHDMSFDEDTNTSDEDFDPLGESGWKGQWDAPPLDEIIFDQKMLQYINSQLNLINIPSWIKRAIPVLGKASFGKLKADEWRNLFTLQLPLILTPLWFGRDQVKTCLLRNFLHLVSLVNLALKRDISSEQIDRYEYHIHEYLSSSLELFQHSHLAPNHHMAIHLSDLLRSFGPVRAWWSFVFERLMGSILKGCHNNHLGLFLFSKPERNLGIVKN